MKPMRHHSFGPRRFRSWLAFTVSELMVVVSIIAVLTFLLLPSLNSVRERGRAVKCLGNLRQMIGAALAYSAENDGYVPRGRWDNASSPSSLNTWYTNLTPYLDSTKIHDATIYRQSAAAQETYNAVWKRLACPSAIKKTTNLIQGISPTYGINVTTKRYNAGYGLQCWSTGRLRKLGSCTMLSRTFAFVDTGGYEYVYEDAYERMGEATWNSLLPARHHHGYHAVFLDGHAELVPEERMKDWQDPMWKAVW